MTTQTMLLVSGTVLLAVSAVSGFFPRRFPRDSESFVRWRLVHAAGAAGAVQLIALGAAWVHFSSAWQASLAACGVAVSTWLFTIGPLFEALRCEIMARWTNRVAALLAVPAYVGLPFALG